ncbi:MAG: hypothetical protein IPH62_19780 [Ignavibacteriae bacterium]|nr:hypothetical protein [Ignavibacteriota bacterium]
MAAIIKSISFKNFYNYYGSFEQNTYHFKEGINIINADNNMGKSKFYNGILWILKDTVYDSDLKRMVNATSSFQKMASGKAFQEETNFEMGVNITFIENANKYSVSKIVQFQKMGDNWNTNELLNILQTIDNKDIPILDQRDKEIIVKKIIPVELMNYALLQGESMEQLVDLSSHNGLSSTIEALAGIRNLIEICEISKDLSQRAKAISNIKEKEINSANKRITDLIQESEEIEKRIDRTFEQIEIYKTELSEATNKKNTLEALLLNAQNRERFRGIQKTLQNEIDKLKDKKNENERNITSMLFSESSPWLLMGLEKQITSFSNNYKNLIIKLAEQRTINKIAADPTMLYLPPNSPDKSSLQRILDTEWCEICDRPALKNSEEWKHIEMVLKRPKSSESSSKNDFSSFYGGIQTTVSSFLNSIPELSKSIEKYRTAIDNLEVVINQKEEEKEIAKLEFLNAGGSENNLENKDRQNISDYTLAEKTIEKKNEDIKKAEAQIKQWETRLNQIKDELNGINANSEIKNYRDFRDMMCHVESILLITKERIFDEILKSLEINANKKYNELTQGNLAEGGKLNFSKQADGTVQVCIKNINDGELTGLGTGFQRMKQLSIIMAIISSKIGNKKFNYPFISDAPFSEFGDNFINNFFKIAPNVFSQSIIFIKELYDPKSEDFLNSLGKRILKKMENGEIPGTFYVNVIEEKADTTNLVTKNKCYKG